MSIRVIQSTTIVGGLELTCYTLVAKKYELYETEDTITLQLYSYFDVDATIAANTAGEYTGACSHTTITVAKTHSTTTFNAQDYVTEALATEIGGTLETIGS